MHGPEHITAFAELPGAIVTTALEAWRLRRAAFRVQAGGPAYLLAAINEGPGAGASLDHSHSQLRAVRGRSRRRSRPRCPHSRRPCALCAAAAGEDERTVRLEAGLRTFVCPRWSRVAYELWIVPEAHTGEPCDPAALTPRHCLTPPAGCSAVLGAELAWNAVMHAAPLHGDAP